ncbi:MAG: cysteine desulfurase NifS [Clostridiales bacterium]|nr:cysteine desulfurase NifS [Clostridiales bacterium]
MTLKVYADNAATTRVSDEVLEAMYPYFSIHYGNPSSLYSLGREAKIAIEKAREQAAALIGAEPNEIIFNSGGSEADNTCIGVYARFVAPKKGKHVISTKIEHHAVLHTLDALKKDGFEVTLLDVDEYGLVSPEALKKAIRSDTSVVSVMFANNEIGTIEPIAELAKITREGGAVFHTDAVQAVGHVAIDVKEMGIDMLSLSAHKLYGPKGTGAMYIRRGLYCPPLIHGGGQENKRRAGTENLAGIVGLGKACEIAGAGLEKEKERVTALRNRLVEGVLKIPYTRLTGHPTQRLPGNASFCIEAIEGESLILMLDMFGIAASTGSACSTGSLDPSHVLMAIGLPHEIAHGSLRFTLGHYSTDEDVDYILEKLPQVVDRLRAMSPVWDDYIK